MERGILAGPEEDDEFSPDADGFLPEEEEEDPSIDGDDQALGDQEGTDDPLEAFFNVHLDEMGDLPVGADQVFAGMETHASSMARETSYSEFPRSREQDYVDTVTRLLPSDHLKEEIPLSLQLKDGIKAEANKWIDSLNDAIGLKLEPYDIPKSRQEAALAQFVGSYGGLVAGGVVLGGPMLGAAALGLTGLHAWTATYDRGDKEKYDSFITEIFGSEGFLPEDLSEMSRGEMAVRIWAAEVVDGLAFGGTLKAGAKLTKLMIKTARTQVARVMGALGEEGKLSLSAMNRVNDAPDPSLFTKSKDEVTEHIKAMDDEVKEMTRLARKARTDSRVQENILKLNEAYMGIDENVRRMNRLTEDIATLRKRTKRLGAFDKTVAAVRPSAVNLAKALDAGPEGMKKFVSGAHDWFDKVRIARAEGDEALDPGIIEEVGTLMEMRRTIVERAIKQGLDETGDPLERDLLKSAREYVETMAKVTVHKSGVKTLAQENLDHTINTLGRQERDLLDYYRRKETYGLSPQDLQSMRRLEKGWRAGYDRLVADREAPVTTLEWLAQKAYYDNLLSGGALSTSLLAGTTGVVSEGIYQGFKLASRGPSLEFARYPIRVMRHATAKIIRGTTSAKEWREAFDIWMGKKLPRRHDKYGYERIYEGSNPLRIGFNMATGTARTTLHLADNLMTVFNEAVASSGALERTLREPFRKVGALEKAVGTGESVARHRGILEKLRSGKFDPKSFMAEHPGFTARFTSELQTRNDMTLFRADPRDYSDRGLLGEIGMSIYEGAVRRLHHSQNIIGRSTGRFFMPFARVWANVLMQADRNTMLGALRVEGGLKDSAAASIKAIGNRRRIFGTGVALGTLLLDNATDNVTVIDAASNEKDLRRTKGESGMLFGDGTFIPWEELGHFGIAVKAQHRFYGMAERTPLVGDALGKLGWAEDWSSFGWGERTGLVLGNFLSFIAEDSFFDRGFTALTYSIATGDGKGMLEWAKEAGAMATSPGAGLINRFVGGEAVPREEADVGSGAVDAFARMVDEMDTVEPQRDFLGVPLTRGEDMGPTTQMVEDFNTLMYVFNPRRRGARPKGQELRDWFIETGAFGDAEMLAGKKRLPARLFKQLFGIEPPKVKQAQRTVSHGGVAYRLSRREYNDKLTLMSLDWKAAERVLDRYEAYYGTKDTVPGREDWDESGLEIVRSAKEVISYREMGRDMRDWYPDMSEDVRLNDIVHHLATAKEENMTREVRESIGGWRRAFLQEAALKRNVSEDLRGMDDKTLEILADNLARMTAIRRLYDMMEGAAQAVMLASPGTMEAMEEPFKGGE